jgi:hypothetical protein
VLKKPEGAQGKYAKDSGLEKDEVVAYVTVCDETLPYLFSTVPLFKRQSQVTRSRLSVMQTSSKCTYSSSQDGQDRRGSLECNAAGSRRALSAQFTNWHLLSPIWKTNTSLVLY